MRPLKVIGADYSGEYKVNIKFSDESTQVVDFGPFLINKPHPQYKKYLSLELFKAFQIENGNLVWGENWDLIFPVYQLHKGKIQF